MGKRSRQRGGAAPQREPEPVRPVGVVERAKASWQVAGDVAPDQEVRQRRRQAFGRRDESTQAPTPGRFRAEAQRRGGKSPTRLDERGERPPSIFGNWPVIEVLTLVGLVLLGIGLAAGARDHARLVEIGVVLVALAALESSVREHLFGYRSHAVFLALLIVIVIHLLVTVVGGGPAGRSDITFGVDIVLFAGIALAMRRIYRASQPGSAAPRSHPKPAGGR